jgi:hypothetical protein
MSRGTGSVYTGESVAAGGQLHVKVDTSVLRVVVCADPAYRQDGRYVTAALRALQQYTRRRMEIDFAERAPERADWLFWLSVRPLPEGVFAHVLYYDPNWNELAWNGSLPVVMGKLLYGEDTDVAEDRRVIDPVQILPAHGGGRGSGVEAAERIELTPAVWWLLLLLFIIERMASHGKRKT